MVHVCLCYAVVYGPCSLMITCWYRADLLALLCDEFSYVFVTFPYGIQNQVRNSIVSMAGLWLPFNIEIHLFWSIPLLYLLSVLRRYNSLFIIALIVRSVPLVDKAPLPLRISRLVTSISLQVENPTHPTAHAPEKIFQYKLQYFFSCYSLIIN